MEFALAVIGLLSATFSMVVAFLQMKAEISKKKKSEEQLTQPVSASYAQYQQETRRPQEVRAAPGFSSQEDWVHGLSLVFAIFLPPFAVYLKKGIGTQFWINVFLTLFLSLFLFIPGPVHALYIVLSSKK